MELYQLRSFAAVAEENHLTRAAERLHLSQPAVSGHIKALEGELGVRLFERASTGMELTAAGKELLEACASRAQCGRRRQAGCATDAGRYCRNAARGHRG